MAPTPQRYSIVDLIIVVGAAVMLHRVCGSRLVHSFPVGARDGRAPGPAVTGFSLSCRFLLGTTHDEDLVQMTLKNG
jgi:hypothetical protein